MIIQKFNWKKEFSFHVLPLVNCELMKFAAMNESSSYFSFNFLFSFSLQFICLGKKKRFVTLIVCVWFVDFLQ